MPQGLHGQRVGLIAELPGWRNPTALSLGIATMGGTCVSVAARLDGAETVEDLASYMDNWFDLIAVRTPRLSQLQSFAEALKAPAMNLRTNDNHPCEVLGDLAFVMSIRASLEGLRVAVVGPAGNIATSWFEASRKMDMEIVQVTPKGFQTNAQKRNFCEVTDDLSAIEDADLIVTDCWPPDLDESAAEAFRACQIDAHHLDRCKEGSLFVPCPPVTRGKEVSVAAMQHRNYASITAKDFLMHAQNAYLIEVLGDD